MVANGLANVRHRTANGERFGERLGERRGREPAAVSAGPRVLLMQLSQRTSAKGNAYLSGWLGKASVVAFQAEEPDKFGNPVWDVFVSTPEPRAEQQQSKPEAGQERRPQARDAGGPANQAARPVGRGDGWRGSRSTAGPRTAPSGPPRPTAGP